MRTLFRTGPSRTTPWAVWEAASSQLPSGLSLTTRQGITGDMARAANDLLTEADLTALLMPGLTALGLNVGFTPLPESVTDLRALLQTQIRRGGLPLYTISAAGPPLREEREPDVDSGRQVAETAGSAVRKEIDRFEPPFETGFEARSAPILAQALAIEIEIGSQGLITARDFRGQMLQMTPAEVQRRFTHALTLESGRKRARRGVGVRAALARWAVFAAAFPERLPGPGGKDRAAWALAERFLIEAAGTGHDRASNRLRQAARYIEQARLQTDFEAALALLREAVCIRFLLPASMEMALIAPDDRPLTAIERRDLIYLARAGTRDLKALAARRLIPERDHADAKVTLEQLRYDPDIWVSVLARRALRDPALTS